MITFTRNLNAVFDITIKFDNLVIPLISHIDQQVIESKSTTTLERHSKYLPPFIISKIIYFFYNSLEIEIVMLL